MRVLMNFNLSEVALMVILLEIIKRTDDKEEKNKKIEELLEILRKSLGC